uniref:Uncharacterized protein n=1 Tax=Rhizophora mucronata TaxID=61149 RepID=A0A2P2Q0H5_RHIMU
MTNACFLAETREREMKRKLNAPRPPFFFLFIYFCQHQRHQSQSMFVNTYEQV